MKTKTPKAPKHDKNPIFKGLAKELKDPTRYKEIEQRLRFAIVSDHKHSTVAGYVNCKRCNKKLQRRQQLMKEYGFKSYPQYVEWRKVMSFIHANDFKYEK